MGYRVGDYVSLTRREESIIVEIKTIRYSPYKVAILQMNGKSAKENNLTRTTYELDPKTWERQGWDIKILDRELVNVLYK